MARTSHTQDQVVVGMTNLVYEVLEQHGHHYRKGSIPMYQILNLNFALAELDDDEEDEASESIRDYGDDIDTLCFVLGCGRN